MPDTLGLYIHIPFCLRKCSYCDFCSGVYDADTRGAYVTALCAEIAHAAPRAAGRVVDTVFFGGGTPTILTADQFTAILDTVRAHYTLAPDVEITTECNPATNVEPLFPALVAAGVNRLSIGLQSVHESELGALGRLHSYNDFLATLAAAQKAGFSNVSADLMYAIPKQTADSLLATLRTVCDLPLSHLSVYNLIIEDNTPFKVDYDSGKMMYPSEEELDKMDEVISTYLPTRGFARYEISNYARNGAVSRHNLRYWQYKDYLGFGVAAHSFFGGVRSQNTEYVPGYLRDVAAGRFDEIVFEKTLISPHDQREEYVMLAMRTTYGVSLAEFEHRFGVPFEATYQGIPDLMTHGLLNVKDGRIFFTDAGFRVSNAILGQWLEFESEEDE